MISKLVKQGKLRLIGGKIDRDQADAALLEFRDPGRDHLRKQPLSPNQNPTTKTAKGEKITYALARTQKEHYQAKLAKLDYERELGKLVSQAQVKREAYATARRLRDQLLAIPSRIAGLLAAEQEQNQVYELLTDELTQALETISHFEEPPHETGLL